VLRKTELEAANLFLASVQQGKVNKLYPIKAINKHCPFVVKMKQYIAGIQ